MDKLGSKTKKNLEEALAGESMARNKYEYFGQAARAEGYEQIAAIFEETARNEKEHAKLWAERLNLIKEKTSENLAEAAAGEHFESSEMYKRMASEAEEEGHQDIALAFNLVARVEEAHEARYRKLAANLEKAQVFRRDEEARWKCGNCGYIFTGREAPPRCPVCQKPQAFFELFCEAY